jgi:hypothetical protein
MKLYELDKPRSCRQLYKFTDTHLNPTAQSHTVAGSLNALVATGKATVLCAVDYILLCKKWLMKIVTASVQIYSSQNPAVIKQTPLLSSFITY